MGRRMDAIRRVRAAISKWFDRAAVHVDRAHMAVPLSFVAMIWLIAWMAVAVAPAWLQIVFHWTWPLWWLSCAALLTLSRHSVDAACERSQRLIDRGCRDRRRLALAGGTVAFAERLHRADFDILLFADLPIMALVGIGLG